MAVKNDYPIAAFVSIHRQGESPADRIPSAAGFNSNSIIVAVVNVLQNHFYPGAIQVNQVKVRWAQVFIAVDTPRKIENRLAIRWLDPSVDVITITASLGSAPGTLRSKTISFPSGDKSNDSSLA